MTNASELQTQFDVSAKQPKPRYIWSNAGPSEGIDSTPDVYVDRAAEKLHDWPLGLPTAQHGRRCSSDSDTAAVHVEPGALQSRAITAQQRQRSKNSHISRAPAVVGA